MAHHFPHPPAGGLGARRLVALLAVVLATVLAGPLRVQGQEPLRPAHGWNARLLVGTGLETSLEFLGREGSGVALVSTLRVGYRGRLRGPFTYALGAEGLFAQRRGRLGELERYRVRTARVGLEGLVGAEVPRTKLTVLAGMQLRTQADLDDFELRRRDNLRFDVRVGASYPVSPRLHATAILGRDLRSRDDSHYAADPRHQALLGVLWFVRDPYRS